MNQKQNYVKKKNIIKNLKKQLNESTLQDGESSLNYLKNLQNFITFDNSNSLLRITADTIKMMAETDNSNGTIYMISDTIEMLANNSTVINTNGSSIEMSIDTDGSNTTQIDNDNLVLRSKNDILVGSDTTYITGNKKLILGLNDNVYEGKIEKGELYFNNSSAVDIDN